MRESANITSSSNNSQSPWQDARRGSGSGALLTSAKICRFRAWSTGMPLEVRMLVCRKRKSGKVRTPSEGVCAGVTYTAHWNTRQRDRTHPNTTVCVYCVWLKGRECACEASHTAPSSHLCSQCFAEACVLLLDAELALLLRQLRLLLRLIPPQLNAAQLAVDARHCLSSE